MIMAYISYLFWGEEPESYSNFKILGRLYFLLEPEILGLINQVIINKIYCCHAIRVSLENAEE